MGMEGDRWVDNRFVISTHSFASSFTLSRALLADTTDSDPSIQAFSDS